MRVDLVICKSINIKEKSDDDYIYKTMGGNNWFIMDDKRQDTMASLRMKC